MSQHMLIFECDQRFVFDDQYFANDSLAMSEKHCRLVSFAPSVQKRASSKKDRYRLGTWLFAIVGRFGFAQERTSFFCRDQKRVVSGQSVSVSVVLVGRRIIQNNKKNTNQ